MNYFKDARVLLAIFIVACAIGGYFYYSKNYKVNKSNGETLENIIAKGINGTDISLYDIKDKVILVQFWAPWCRPCIKETPGLVKLYNTFHSSSFSNGNGFEIFSFSLDQDSVRWKNAIAALNMNWDYHVNDELMFKSLTAKRLNVASIPTNILIDKDHTIIGVDLEPEEVEKILLRFKN
jgi:thiol-disulfide isomerase/thioredoxin